MKHVYTFAFSEAPQAEMYQRILAVEGIATVIRNDRLSAALGQIPFTECFPELWVLDEEDAERAETLLAAYLSPPNETNRPSWVCPQCHETIEGQYGQCWKCDHSAPELTDENR